MNCRLGEEGHNLVWMKFIPEMRFHQQPANAGDAPGPFAIVLVVHGVATWESDAANRFYDILSLVCVEHAPFGTIHDLFFVFVSFSWRAGKVDEQTFVYSNLGMMVVVEVVTSETVMHKPSSPSSHQGRGWEGMQRG